MCTCSKKRNATGKPNKLWWWNAELWSLSFVNNAMRNIRGKYGKPNQGLSKICAAIQGFLRFFLRQKVLNEDRKLLIETTIKYTKTISIAPTPFITDSEVNEAMSEISKASVVGEDGLSTELILCSNNATASYLIEIYNACLLHCYFPSDWIKARVIIFKKPGKE